MAHQRLMLGRAGGGCGGGLLLLWALTACAGPASAPPGSPVAASMASGPVAATPSADGAYRGVLTSVRGPSACARSKVITLTIDGGVATYRSSRSVVFTGPVAADGSFSATSFNTTMQGRVGAGEVTGTLDGEHCGYTFDLKKTAASTNPG